MHTIPNLEKEKMVTADHKDFNILKKLKLNIKIGKNN